MRKLLPFAVAAFVLWVPITASAQTYEPGAVVLSDSSVQPGESFTASGSGCPPGEAVVVTLDGESTTTTSDGNGNWATTMTAPSEPGTYTVTATCGSRVLNAELRVGSAGATAGPPLVRTGSSSVVAMSRIGVALGAAGGVILMVARRHRAKPAVG